MNIQLLTPQFFNKVRNNNQNFQHNTNTSSPLAPLKADTVSFSGGAQISEFLESSFMRDNPRLLRIATTYLDVLESVAYKLKDKGFSFDRAYCELNPVKSPASRKSKVIRSQSFKIPDTIRATLYCNDPYDLAKLNDELLPLMEQRGYVLADTRMSIQDLMKRGYIPTDEEIKLLEKLDTQDLSQIEENELRYQLSKSVPDLDIRLEDASEQIAKLPPELRYCIGKPQKSGYEDIQMRFVRNFDKKKNPIQHELLILFGPNYSQAKHEESKYVYSFLRKFSELHAGSKDVRSDSDLAKINRYVDLIKHMFSGKVSQKLFLNGKNKDYADIPDEIPINFSDDDVKLFEGYFNGLRFRLSNLCKQNRAASESLAEKRMMTKEYNADRNLVEDIYNGLKATIEHFNSLAKQKEQ